MRSLAVGTSRRSGRTTSTTRLPNWLVTLMYGTRVNGKRTMYPARCSGSCGAVGPSPFLSAGAHSRSARNAVTDAEPNWSTSVTGTPEKNAGFTS